MEVMKKYIVIFILMLLIIILSWYFLIDKYLLPRDVIKSINSSETVHLFSIEPEKNITKEDTLLGYYILRKRLLNKHDAHLAFLNIDEAATKGGNQADCFNPRHAIQFIKNNKEYSLLICFECNQMIAYCNNEFLYNYTITGKPDVLDKLLSLDSQPLKPDVLKKYFFSKKPFVHPKIIKELTPTIETPENSVSSINLFESMESKKYFGEITIKGESDPYVFTDDFGKDEDGNLIINEFGYQYIGITSSGIIVLYTRQEYLATNVTTNLLLLTVEYDQTKAYDPTINGLEIDKERCFLKKQVIISLGERYQGKVTLVGDILKINKDESGLSSAVILTDKQINLRKFKKETK